MIEYPEDSETRLFKERLPTSGRSWIGKIEVEHIDTYNHTKDIMRRVDIARGKIVLIEVVTNESCLY